MSRRLLSSHRWWWHHQTVLSPSSMLVLTFSAYRHLASSERAEPGSPLPPWRARRCERGSPSGTGRPCAADRVAGAPLWIFRQESEREAWENHAAQFVRLPGISVHRMGGPALHVGWSAPAFDNASLEDRDYGSNPAVAALPLVFRRGSPCGPPLRCTNCPQGGAGLSGRRAHPHDGATWTASLRIDSL